MRQMENTQNQNKALLERAMEMFPVEEGEIKMVRAYIFGPKEAVIVYQVTPERSQDCYLVTYKLGGDESPWGMGLTVKQALEDASFQWRTLDPDHQGPNDPFKLALAFEEGQ